MSKRKADQDRPPEYQDIAEVHEPKPQPDPPAVESADLVDVFLYSPRPDMPAYVNDVIQAQDVVSLVQARLLPEVPAGEKGYKPVTSGPVQAYKAVDGRTMLVVIHKDHGLASQANTK
jgi:hypothetical protein